MLMIIILICILFITLWVIQIRQEQSLINLFKENDIYDDRLIIQESDNNIDSFELLLVNLDILPSYMGKYQSLLFDNKFHLECYRDFYILIMNTNMSSYRIKIPKMVCSIKNDIFLGKSLKIKLKKHSLLFKLPNELQNIMYKDLCKFK